MAKNTYTFQSWLRDVEYWFLAAGIPRELVLGSPKWRARAVEYWGSLHSRKLTARQAVTEALQKHIGGK